METQVKSGRLLDAKDQALVFALLQEAPLKGELKELDKLTSGQVSALLKSGDFSGKLNQALVFYSANKIATPRIILVGLGKGEKYDLDKVRQAYGSATRKVRELKLKSFSTSLPEDKPRGAISYDMAQAVTEGVNLANYQMDIYKTEDKNEIVRLDNFTIWEKDKKIQAALEKGKAVGEITSWASNYARDLINYPGNFLTPTKLAQEAKKLADTYGFKAQIITEPELKKLNFGALLGVARGSQEPPCFIVLEYNGKKNSDTICLVGKGVTFDSGGISIKPAEKMEEMKGDMTGAAAVICTMAAVARLKLPVNVVALAPATENLPSGTAIKPGDILKSYSGKTIEVINTDAEGRLILADALAYASQFKPKAIIDLATLTGACIVALGHVTCGMMGTDERLKNRLRIASQKTAERVWELPLYEEYDEQIKSDLADVKNSGGRPAGAITAARFLKKFVGDFPWVHLDIAGMDLEFNGKPYIPKGGTGFGVRLLIQLLRDWGSR